MMANNLKIKVSKSANKIFKNTGKFFKTNKILKKIYLGLGIAVVLFALLFLSFSFLYQGKIYPKTFIGQENYGGKSRSQAQDLVIKHADTSKDGKLSYEWNLKQYEISFTDLKVDYNSKLTSSLNRLFAVGRTGTVSKIMSEKFRSVFSKNNVQADFVFDEEKLNQFLVSIAKDINLAEKDAGIVFREGKPYVSAEEIGREFPIEENRKIALKTIGEFNLSNKTAFVINNLNPKITTEIANKALAKTEELMAHKLTMSARDQKFVLEGADLEQIIEFKAASNALEPSFTAEKIGLYLDKITPQINQEAKNSQFKVSDGKVVAFGLSQTGYELEKEKAITEIISALEESKTEIELPVKITEPSVDSDDPSKAGLKELIAEGKTSWRGSPANRIHNLTLGASKISGTVVAPGEEFSTVKTISPITVGAGFLPELVIKNSTMVEPEIGGGLCQVSTTLFRAVLNSGLKITARTAHSFRVPYYEPPVGMDATIYDPAPDFKFINNMSTPILIWAFAGYNDLTFQIYGTKDDRVAEISDPIKYNYVSPPDPVYSESASMAAGAIRMVERATAGVSTSFTYKVIAKNGEVLENDTFVSKYVPVPDTYLYGAGADVPSVQGTSAPAPAPAPEPDPTPLPVIKKGE